MEIPRVVQLLVVRLLVAQPLVVQQYLVLPDSP
jgi:hypothetical protein